MRSYKDVFSECRGAALVPFFVLGDPNPELSLELLVTAVDAGADVLELGIPFSDPIADGPTIQKADIRALRQGIDVGQSLELIRRFKDQRDVPVGLLMYYNLIIHYGTERFFRDAAKAGVNSVLIADLPIDDAGEVLGFIRSNGLDTVFMVSPNTSLQRREKIVKLCTGFIYTVAVLGVTGARAELGELVVPLVESLKSQTDVPVCVGFGVSRPEHASELVYGGADGVIVGSAVVDIVANNLSEPERCKAELGRFIGIMKEACMV